MPQPTDTPPTQVPPVYRVTATGLIHGHTIPTVTIPAPATAEEIVNAVYVGLSALRDREDIDLVVTINLDAGTGTLLVVPDEDEVPLTVTGPGGPPAGWPQELAAELHRVADQIAGLPADTRRPEYAHVSLIGSYDERAAAQMSPVVDTIAAALDLPAAATDKISGSTYYYEARVKRGLLDVRAFTKAPAPEDPEVAALRARIAELEAQQGGAR